MKVLVTGADGFIGKHLLPVLSKAGHEIATLDLPGHPVTYPVDITNTETMSKLDIGRVDACIHLAALAAPRIAEKQPELCWSVNVHGTYNVLQLLKRSGVEKSVFLSSAHVYGISPKALPTDENHPLSLGDVYTTTKILGEQLFDLFWRNHGMAYTTLRLFNSYAGNQAQPYFIPDKVAEAKAGRITMRGNSSTTKDWIYISDVVRAIQLALESDFVGPVNIGSGTEVSLGEIAAMVSEHFGAPIDWGNGEGKATRMQADWSRARRVLGWEPKVKFEDGLRMTLEAADR